MIIISAIVMLPFLCPSNRIRTVSAGNMHETVTDNSGTHKYNIPGSISLERYSLSVKPFNPTLSLTELSDPLLKPESSEKTDTVILSESENCDEKFTYSEEYESGTMVSDNYTEMPTPVNNGFKSYMDRETITDRNSAQYAFLQNAYLNENGLWMSDERYCAALGSYYTTDIGTYFDLVMDNGSIIPCVLAECKSDYDTDSLTHRQNPNGSISEFVVDTPSLPSSVTIAGSISALGGIFDGEIESIRVYNN